MTVLARVADNPAAFTVAIDAANLALNFSPALGLNLNERAGPGLGVSFTLSAAQVDLPALEDLILVVKVDFT